MAEDENGRSGMAGVEWSGLRSLIDVNKLVPILSELSSDGAIASGRGRGMGRHGEDWPDGIQALQCAMRLRN